MGADGLAGDRIPQPHRAVAAGAGQQLAVGAERHPAHVRRWGRCRPGRGAPTAWPVAGSHNRTVPSPPALASSLPSGLNATPYTLPLRAGGGRQGRADGLAGGRIPQPHRAVAAGGGQQLAVRAERHPEHAASRRCRRCRGVPTGRPVAGSHNRTVPSPPALASSLPSGLNATPLTPPLPPVPAVDRCADGLAGDRIPQPHRAVVAGAGQQLAVRAERHPGHAADRGRCRPGGACRRAGRWPDPTTAPCRRRRRWPAACRPG